MRVIKILLRIIFTLFALAILFTGVNVGFIKSSVVAILFLFSGFLMTHPIGGSAETSIERNFKNRKIGVFLLGCALFTVAVGLAVSSEFLATVQVTVLASIIAVAGYRFLYKNAE